MTEIVRIISSHRDWPILIWVAIYKATPPTKSSQQACRTIYDYIGLLLNR